MRILASSIQDKIKYISKLKLPILLIVTLGRVKFVHSSLSSCPQSPEWRHLTASGVRRASFMHTETQGFKSIYVFMY